jgi:hypothetical protein
LGEFKSLAPVAVSSRVELLKAIQKGWKTGYRIRWVLPRKENPVPHLQVISEAIWDAQAPCMGPEGTGPGVTFAVEEMAAALPNKQTFTTFQGLCERGRHYQIRLVGTAQRLAKVHPDFRNACGVNYFFPMESETDYQEAAKLLRPCGREWVDRLRSLKPHEYIVKRNGQAEFGKNQKK